MGGDSRDRYNRRNTRPIEPARERRTIARSRTVATPRSARRELLRRRLGPSVNRRREPERRARIERSNLPPESYAARPDQGMPERLEGIHCPLLVVQGGGVERVPRFGEKRQQSRGGLGPFLTLSAAHSSPASTNE